MSLNRPNTDFQVARQTHADQTDQLDPATAETSTSPLSDKPPRGTWSFNDFCPAGFSKTNCFSDKFNRTHLSPSRLSVILSSCLSPSFQPFFSKAFRVSKSLVYPYNLTVSEPPPPPQDIPFQSTTPTGNTILHIEFLFSLLHFLQPRHNILNIFLNTLLFSSINLSMLSTGCFAIILAWHGDAGFFSHACRRTSAKIRALLRF